jgi:hypothetical protein
MSHLTLVKLFRNLTPEFGAIEVGAELVQVNTTLLKQGVPPSGSAQKPLEPTCTASAPSSMVPNLGVRFRNSFAERLDEALVLSKGQICQKLRIGQTWFYGKYSNYTVFHQWRDNCFMGNEQI